MFFVELYFNISLVVPNCENSNHTGIEKTIPDKNCAVEISEDNRKRYIKENVNISSLFPDINELNYFIGDINLYFISYLALISQNHADPNCALCKEEAKVARHHTRKPHFRLLISFEL